MWVIRYQWPEGKVRYDLGTKLAKTRDDATLHSFKKALDRLVAAKEAHRLWGITASMEAYLDSSEKPGKRVRSRSLQTSGNTPRTKDDPKKRKMEVGGRGRGTKEDQILSCYNALGEDYIAKLLPGEESEETVLKRIALMSRHQVKMLNLEEPFPSNPFRPTRYCLWLIDGERRSCVTLYATYAAKKAFDLACRGEKYEWKNPEEVVFPDGRRVKCNDLEDIVEYEYTSRQAEYIMPEPYYGFLTGNPVASALPQVPEDTRAEKLEQTRRSSASRQVGKPKDGDWTPQHVANYLKITPEVTRAQLRKLKLQKPYVWSEEEGKKIAEQVAKRLKSR